MKLIPLAALALAACSGPAPETRSDGAMTSVGATENGVLPDNAADNSLAAAPAAGNAAVAAASAPAAAPDYTGHWVGVEGLVLDVTSAGAPGRYRLAMQYDLDHKETVEGTARGDTIVFERQGKRETLRPTDGDGTGLKYLAGKTQCLTVAPGEGYCRG